MLQSASKGRLTVHHADIMKFHIPDAFPRADVVRWESNGTITLRFLSFFLHVPFQNVIVKGKTRTQNYS